MLSTVTNFSPSPSAWNRLRNLKHLQQVVHIGISRTDITVVQSSGIWKKTSQLLRQQSLYDNAFTDHAVLADQLRSLLSELNCQYSSICITLDDAFSRMWMVTPPQNATRLSDCEAAAAQRFYALFGGSASDWEIAANWDSQNSFLACALPRSLIVQIKNVADEFQMTIFNIAPHFVVAWNRWRHEIKDGSWFGVVQHDVITLATVAGGRLTTVRAVSLDEASRTRAWIDQHIQREGMLHQLQTPKRLCLTGQLPQSWFKNDGQTMLCLPLELQLAQSSLAATSSELMVRSAISGVFS